MKRYLAYRPGEVARIFGCLITPVVCRSARTKHVYRRDTKSARVTRDQQEVPSHEKTGNHVDNQGTQKSRKTTEPHTPHAVFVPRRDMSCHVITRQNVPSCYGVSCHFMLCHIKATRVMSCFVVS